MKRRLRGGPAVVLVIGAATAAWPLACSSETMPGVQHDSSGDSGASADATRDTTPPIDSRPPQDVANDVPVTPPRDSETDAPLDAGDGGQTAATCSNHIKDGNETDVDCGGGTCPPCRDGLKCGLASDCASASCTSNTCAVANCQDHIKNGAETDIDCGGGTCPPCLVGKQCVTTGDCASALCNNATCACKGGMITMPTALALGGAYCIDPTEVTRKDYNDFWTANPNLGANLPASCSFKTSYTPSNDWPPTLIQGGNGGFPVRYVDWCDAYAYCVWKGKRLCGAIAGGANPVSSASDRLKDSWYNACSAEGANAWPYGSTYQALACDGADYTAANGGSPPTLRERDDNGTIIPSSCQGGASGLYHMSGNVAEWEDSCDANAGPTDSCLVRGGGYNSAAAALRCDASATAARQATLADVGFRCCL